MRRLVSHDAWTSFIGMIYLGIVVNLLLLATCLPLVIALITTNPAISWPLLAGLAPFCLPGVAAALRTFREHDEGGLSPVRAFVAGLRDTWRRSLLLGVIATVILVVALIDIRAVAPTAAAAIAVPVLGVLCVLTVTVALISLVALVEAPAARWRDIVRAALFLGVRRWYLSAFSLVGIVIHVGIFTSAPAIGLGITASAILYLVWANSRFTLRPVLDLNAAAAA